MLPESSGARAFVTPTRVHIPRVPHKVVRRARLVEHAVGSRPITLVCAPAGSGKTMLVADWAAGALADGQRVAWVSLEDRDDRPYEFWSAVIEALIAATDLDTSHPLRALSPPLAGMEPRFIATLTQTIASSNLRWLVLDEVHRLHDPDVLAGLDVLLAEAPADVGVVLISRSEPRIALHRLRLSDRVADIRWHDLAFTEAEAGTLFRLMHAPAQPSEVARLVSRTEGWAAGLRLAAVSVSAARDPADFVAAFEGDQRTVADYLFAEIIQHLPEDLVDFLVSTCVPKQLSMDLAAHLSGRADSGEMLERLCRANALVVRSGNSSWYRYHSLLRGYLRAELRRRDVEAPRQQHVRTALWFNRHREPSVALEHAAKADDDALLCDLLRENGLRMILSGQAGMVRDLVLSHAPSVLSDRPVVILGTLAALDVNDLDSADEWLALLADTEDTAIDSGFAALRATAIVQRSLVGGDPVQALKGTAILDRVATGDGDVDLMTLAYRAPARMRTGDYKAAIDDLERALALAHARGYDRFVLGTLSQLSGMNGAICDFEASLRWAERAIDFATARGWADSPRLAYAYLLAAWTPFQTGDVPAQAHYAELGLRALEGVNNVEVEVGVRSMHALATFEQASGPERLRAAETFHSIWQGAAVDQVSPALKSLATPQEVRITLLAGRMEWAEEAVGRIERQMPGTVEGAAARAQLLAAKGRTRDAITVLKPVVEGEITAHVPTTGVIAHVLAAGLEVRLDNPHRAFEALQAALEWAAPNNYRRPFLDAWHDIGSLLRSQRGRFGPAEGFVERLLEAERLVNLQSATVVNHVLTDRELTVLRDLPALMTLSEVAEARGVSENTVKTHVRAIYQKLGVNNRAAAVREARHRGLL